MGAADNRQPQGSLFLLLNDRGGRRGARGGWLVLLALASAKFLRIGEN
jgi:hypothetical protein